MRELRYQAIADDLRRRIEAGEYGSGSLLPSEADLSASYAASRVTVRRALEVLRSAGLVGARQGLGWFAAADPVRQTLGRLGTIEDQLASAGMASERRIVGFRFVRAPARPKQVLAVDTVLEVVRVNTAIGPQGDLPFARITVWCPEDLGGRAVAGRRRPVVVLRPARSRDRRGDADDRRRLGRCRRMRSCSRCPWARRCCCASG